MGVEGAARRVDAAPEGDGVAPEGESATRKATVPLRHSERQRELLLEQIRRLLPVLAPPRVDAPDVPIGLRSRDGGFAQRRRRARSLASTSAAGAT